MAPPAFKQWSPISPLLGDSETLRQRPLVADIGPPAMTPNDPKRKSADSGSGHCIHVEAT